MRDGATARGAVLETLAGNAGETRNDPQVSVESC